MFHNCLHRCIISRLTNKEPWHASVVQPKNSTKNFELLNHPARHFVLSFSHCFHRAPSDCFLLLRFKHFSSFSLFSVLFWSSTWAVGEIREEKFELVSCRSEVRELANFFIHNSLRSTTVDFSRWVMRLTVGWLSLRLQRQMKSFLIAWCRFGLTKLKEPNGSVGERSVELIRKADWIEEIKLLWRVSQRIGLLATSKPTRLRWVHRPTINIQSETIFTVKVLETIAERDKCKSRRRWSLPKAKASYGPEVFIPFASIGSIFSAPNQFLSRCGRSKFLDFVPAREKDRRNLPRVTACRQWFRFQSTSRQAQKAKLIAWNLERSCRLLKRVEKCARK